MSTEQKKFTIDVYNNIDTEYKNYLTTQKNIIIGKIKKLKIDTDYKKNAKKILDYKQLEVNLDEDHLVKLNTYKREDKLFIRYILSLKIITMSIDNLRKYYVENKSEDYIITFLDALKGIYENLINIYKNLLIDENVTEIEKNRLFFVILVLEEFQNKENQIMIDTLKSVLKTETEKDTLFYNVSNSIRYIPK
jgi:hypothetical protein